MVRTVARHPRLRVDDLPDQAPSTNIQSTDRAEGREPASASPLVACHECDLLESVPPLGQRATLKCRRCGAVLYRHKPDSVQRTLALTIAGLALFGLTNAYPFLGFEIQGVLMHTTLLGGVRLLYDAGDWPVAAVVLGTAVLAPLLQLLAMLAVSLPLYFNRHPWDVGRLFRVIQHLQPWSMLEVFMLGILVSVVKLSKMATIIPGPSLWAFVGLMVVVTAATSTLDPVEVWKRLEQRR